MTRHPAGAVVTPWGHTGELKERKLQPGRGTARVEVFRNQRERLFGGVIAVVSERGYEETTVADIISACGISRSDFYKHFANKANCLAAAADALLEPTLRSLEEAKNEEPNRAEAVFERFIELVASQPAAARVCFVELYAAGEEGKAVADRAFEALAMAVEEACVDVPEFEELEAGLARRLIGGIAKLVHTRLYRRREAELEALVPELWRWLVSVRPPPVPLQAPRRRAASTARFEGYTPAERIAKAVATVVAGKGYAQMTTDDVAAEAAISLSTFYDHFSDKQDAMLAALEMSGAQIIAVAAPAARRAGDWKEGVRSLFEAICAYFAAEPALAQLTLIEVYGAGAEALARRDRVIDSLAEMLAPGFHENPEAAAVSAEASAATVYALMREQMQEGGSQSLSTIVPLATYISLVPFAGPEQACAVANGGGRRS
jgi:TetR/AcrR family transcriptional regulator